MKDNGITILARVRPNGERYIFIFDDDNRRSIRQRLGQMAIDPDLSFSWVDAAMVASKMRTRTFYKVEDAT
jgi:hypothetical protein